MHTRAKGSVGEAIATNYLRHHGFEVVAKNFANKMGEIDIIALRENTFHFVEVKYRQNENFGRGLESVNYAKQKTIHRVAMAFLQSKGLWGEVDLSFDVIDILGTPTNHTIEYLEACF